MTKETGGPGRRDGLDGPRAFLKRVGVRVTAARLDVYTHLLRERRPLSHQEIAIRHEHHDRVTLYRTLNRLAAAGLVHAVLGLEGVWRFCAHPPLQDGCPGNHPHFLCLSCGRMACLTDQKLPHVEVPSEVAVEGKQLLVYGRCVRCMGSKRPAAGRSAAR
jgi:Fur family ferric uptake transcriptional regulator